MTHGLYDGERGELEEGPAGVDQPLDPLARQELPALLVAVDRRLAAAGPGSLELGLEVGHQLGHPLAVSEEVIRGGVEMTRDAGHGPKGTQMCG